MKTPDTIYLQTCGNCCGQDCENCNFDTLLRIATKKGDADVIEVEKSIETAIKKLKGGKK